MLKITLYMLALAFSLPIVATAGPWVSASDFETASVRLIDNAENGCWTNIGETQKRHRPMSNMAMLMLLRRMKVEGITVHGFRSAFRDWASEQPGVSREIAELSLAHTIGSEVERAYARSDLLDKRRQLMSDWTEYVA
ncbi:tyrosine-type recombinase/integrase [Roseobacter sp.]|uniref:tyrosine-type recombinase/integrase n=1 Tax=Roseobacter sp. TaxID=1907202 RepID=UPI003858E42B